MSATATAINVVAAVCVLWALEAYGHKVDWQIWFSLGGWWLFSGFVHAMLDKDDAK